MKKKEKLYGHPAPNRPDLDNYIKFILDAGLKILWTDDNIITKITACKLYATEPETIIQIELDNE